MQVKLILAVFALSATFYACQNPTADTSPAAEDSAATAAPMKAADPALAGDIDPVCGMSVDLASSDTLHYKEKVLGFCSASCKKQFAQNPTEFIKD